jgi:peroxisomal 3,2-trans-enoyl-CoA isomerase
MLSSPSTCATNDQLNAWTMPLMREFESIMIDADSRSDLRGVVVTGNGAYYSAGVDLSALLAPMAPSKLIVQLRDHNQALFDRIINFSKPMVAAVNGPAIGAAVTTATLMDAIYASERATFSLPFAKVGVPPEGCSSVTFAEWMGEKNAERMLGIEGWTPTSTDAVAAGFPITEVVGGDNDALVTRAVEAAEAMADAGGERRYNEAEKARLRKINAVESAELANRVFSAHFLDAMHAFNKRRGKTQAAFFFAAARTTLPLWAPAKIEPKFED